MSVRLAWPRDLFLGGSTLTSGWHRNASDWPALTSDWPRIASNWPTLTSDWPQIASNWPLTSGWPRIDLKLHRIEPHWHQILTQIASNWPTLISDWHRIVSNWPTLTSRIFFPWHVGHTPKKIIGLRPAVWLFDCLITWLFGCAS